MQFWLMCIEVCCYFCFVVWYIYCVQCFGYVMVFVVIVIGDVCWYFVFVVLEILQEIEGFGYVYLGQQLWIVRGVGFVLCGLVVDLCMDVVYFGYQCFYFVVGCVVGVGNEGCGMMQVFYQVLVEIGVVIDFGQCVWVQGLQYQCVQVIGEY